jgi:SAM-dependent methyltransferase
VHNVCNWPTWRCPDHHLDLQEGNEALRCPAGHDFAVHGLIPRFVHGPNYADAFGLQWRVFRRTQLDSYTGLSITRDRARRSLGPAWDELSGALVLEAGCGAGRFTEVLLGQGACVVSVDLSSAVDANRENFPVGPNHRVAQADIQKLPFSDQIFDVVFCLGVLHALPSPELGLDALYKLVKPGGLLVVDTYPFSLGWYLRTAPIFREVLRRLPPERSLMVTRALVRAFLPLHRAVRRSVVLSKLLVRVSPVISYYHALPALPEVLQREWALLDTNNSLTDWYLHFRTRPAIERRLGSLGVTEVYCVHENGLVLARGRRPLGSRQ